MSSVAPLSIDASLDEASRCHSQDMAENTFLDTTGTDGSDGRERATEAGYPVGLVVSFAHGWFETPAEVVDDWMSVTHMCEWIMSPSLEHIGAALAENSAGEHHYYWTLKMGQPF